MGIIISMIFVSMFFYRERLDNTVNLKIDVPKDNYILFLSIYYLFNVMFMLFIVELLNPKNEFITNLMYLSFDNICNTVLLFAFAYSLQEVYKKNITIKNMKLKDFPVGFKIVIFCFLLKLWASYDFFIDFHNIDDKEQFIYFISFSCLLILLNFLYNKEIRKNIKCQKCNT